MVHPCWQLAYNQRMYWIMDRFGCDVLNEYHVHESLVVDHVDHHTFNVLDIRDPLLRDARLRECGIR